MYGITDELIGMREEIKVLRNNLFDLKLLVKLMLERPNDAAVRKAVEIAVNNIQS